MDVSALVSILAPCLGLLITGANAVADEVGKSVAPVLLKHAKRLWAKLRPHVEAKPAALEAAEDVAQRPDDERTRAALELQLEKLLAGDPALLDALAPVLRDAVAAGAVAAGERAVAVGGNVTGSVIVTGDSAVIRDQT
jgi:hypothetical protein